MGNPTSINGGLAVVEAATAERSVLLDATREYTLAHDGETVAGVADTNTIYLSTDSTVTPAAGSGSGKFKLLAGRSVVVGPHVAVLRFKTASGAPTMSVSPSAPISPLLR